MGKILLEITGFPQTLIKPCKQQDVPMAAPRPSDVSLNSSKASGMGFCPGTMREELQPVNVFLLPNCLVLLDYDLCLSQQN
jgi:dTDP-4-dehydrorhamnose reductase